MMRYSKMTMNHLGMHYLHRRNPWAAAWWSVALPGLGHFYVGSYLKGFIMMTFEIAVNLLANLNLGIYHSFLGQFDLAQQVLDMKWAVLYPPVYLLSVWDAYRSAVDQNRYFELERLQEQRSFSFEKINVFSLNYLTKRNPGMALLSSMLMMGGGHFYNNELIKGTVLMGWGIALAILSGLARAAVYTLLGEPAMGNEQLNYQWLLFWPSVQMFNIWNAYVDCVEQNKLCDEARQYWLRHGLKSWNENPTSS